MHLGTLVVSSSSSHGLSVWNAASPWASEEGQLMDLFTCRDTALVTTRTATLHGFPEDPQRHQMAFIGHKSSINNYAYSPHPLSYYLELIPRISQKASTQKPFLISITGTPEELQVMLEAIQQLRRSSSCPASGIGVEFNASCPNISDKPPPAYHPDTLALYLQPLLDAVKSDPTFTIGVKLPPFTVQNQFDDLFSLLKRLPCLEDSRHPVAFLSCTNTLGCSLAFEDQVTSRMDNSLQNAQLRDTALPAPAFGGLAGQAIHPLSLGNVAKFRQLIDSAGLTGKMALVGIGGIADAQGVRRMARAGADAVAVATALGEKGVQVFQDCA